MAYSPQTPPTYSSILQQQSETVPVTMRKVKAATQLIAMKLDDNYYLLWKQQIFAAAEGFGLEGFPTGSTRASIRICLSHSQQQLSIQMQPGF